MSSPGDDTMEFLLADLRAEYLAALPARVQELRAALAQCATSTAAREDLQRFAHRIAGTAGTVGLLEVGRAGRALEETCARCDWTESARRGLAESIARLDDLASRDALGGLRRPSEAAELLTGENRS